MTEARAVIMALPNPVILIGQDDRIVALNSAARRLIGTDAEGWHYITALRQPAVLDAIETTLRDGGQRTARFLGNDGARDTTWEVTIRGVALDRGVTVVASFQDLTALEDAGAMRRDFVANVSHEMRTPLTSMMGFIETLRGSARNDRAAQDRFLGIMAHEAERLHRLVEDLLSLSRVEDQERIRPTESVALHPLIDDVLESLAPMVDTDRIQILRDLPQDPVVVLGDRGQLWQVLSNLIENAIKYGAKDGQIVVRLTPPAMETSLRQIGTRLSVIDQGEGIPPYHIARLTERFYRVDSHRSREVGGTGLGLAIVKHIIARHRGRLRIDSVIGQGTDFTVILPTTATE